MPMSGRRRGPAPAAGRRLPLPDLLGHRPRRRHLRRCLRIRRRRLLPHLSSLVKSDPGSADIYDARVGGGFPEPLRTDPLQGDACVPLPQGPEDPSVGSLIPGLPNPPVHFPKTHKCPKARASPFATATSLPRHTPRPTSASTRHEARSQVIALRLRARPPGARRPAGVGDLRRRPPLAPQPIRLQARHRRLRLPGGQRRRQPRHRSRHSPLRSSSARSTSPKAPNPPASPACPSPPPICATCASNCPRG